MMSSTSNKNKAMICRAVVSRNTQISQTQQPQPQPQPQKQQQKRQAYVAPATTQPNSPITANMANTDLKPTSSSRPNSKSLPSTSAPTSAPTLALTKPVKSNVQNSTTTSTNNNNNNSVKYLIAGAVSGIISRTFVSPLEVLSTIAMISTSHRGAASSMGTGVLDGIQRIWKQEGIKGLFKGNMANCLKVAPTKGIQFVVFEGIKRLMVGAREKGIKEVKGREKRTQTQTQLTALERLIAGGLAGIVAASICYPLEVSKTLLTALPKEYTGILGSMSKIVREKGMAGLYRGIGPTMVAMFPYVGLEFMVYEQMKMAYGKRMASQNKSEEPPILVMLLIGAFAGALAQTTCHPLDVIRKRLQLQGIGGRPMLYTNTLQAAVRIVREEGVGALYRGLKPAYLSALPSAGVSYVVYEHMKQVLGVQSLK